MLKSYIISYYNKRYCFKSIKFNTEDYFTEHKNITMKLKWKLFTKVIREQSKEAWVRYTESN